MINFKTVLKQSIPKKELKTSEIVKTLLIAVALIYFIFVFLEPFDFNVGKYNKYSIFLLFSFCYFLVLFVAIKWILPFINKLANVTSFYFYHFILGYLFLIILVAFTHHALQNYLNGFPIISLKLFSKVLFHAIVIGLIPTTILSLISYTQALKKQIKSSIKNLTKSLHKIEQKGIITIASTNGKDFYRFQASSIIYIKSEDNYINVVYQNEKNSAIQNELIRTTLKVIATKLNLPFLRVHRSYIINLNKVSKISGNAQGMQLIIQSENIIIPVSRSYINTLKEALQTT